MPARRSILWQAGWAKPLADNTPAYKGFMLRLTNRIVLCGFKESVFAGNMKPPFFVHPANRLIFTGKLTGMAGF